MIESKAQASAKAERVVDAHICDQAKGGNALRSSEEHRDARRSARLATIGVPARDISRAKPSASQQHRQKRNRAVVAIRHGRRRKASFGDLPAELLEDIAFYVAGEHDLWENKRLLLGYRLVQRNFAPFITAALISTSTVVLEGPCRPGAVQFTHFIKQAGIGNLVRSLSFATDPDCRADGQLEVLYKTQSLETIITCLKHTKRLRLLHMRIGLAFAWPEHWPLLDSIRSFAYTQWTNSLNRHGISNRHLVRYISAAPKLRELELGRGDSDPPDLWTPDVIEMCSSTSFKQSAARFEQITVRSQSSAGAREIFRYIRFTPVRFFVEINEYEPYSYGYTAETEQYEWLFQVLADATFVRNLKRVHVQIWSGHLSPSHRSRRLESLLRGMTESAGVQTSCTLLQRSQNWSPHRHADDTIPWLIHDPTLDDDECVPGLAAAQARLKEIHPQFSLVTES